MISTTTYTFILLVCAASVASGFSRRNAVTDPDRLWSNGIIPYTFHPGIDAYRKVHLLAGMKQVMLSVYSGGKPCILFVPRTTEADYIQFRFVDEEGKGGAHVGRSGGQQIAYIQKQITQDTIVMVLMFVTGIYPEVSRQDRDNILNIVTSNIDPSVTHAFTIEQNTDTFSQPFDYSSAVMYGPYFGAKDPSMPTIKTKYDGFTLGQTVSMSDNDVNLVQHVYKCSRDSSHRVDILGPLVFECHFHTGMCQFVQDRNDDFDWAIQDGPTSTAGTGPNADHSSGSGNYAVAIAAGHHSQIARLKTPTFPAGEYCFVAWIHAYGSDVGQIRAIQTNADGDKAVFGVSVTPENMWYHGSGTVTSLNSPVTISVEAFMGSGDQGDIAIDDIYIYKGECIDWY